MQYFKHIFYLRIFDSLNTKSIINKYKNFQEVLRHFVLCVMKYETNCHSSINNYNEQVYLSSSREKYSNTMSVLKFLLVKLQKRKSNLNLPEFTIPFPKPSGATSPNLSQTFMF